MQVTPATAVTNLFVLGRSQPEGPFNLDVSGFRTVGFQTKRFHQVAWVEAPIFGTAFNGTQYSKIIRLNVASFRRRFDLLSRFLSRLCFYTNDDDYVRDCGRYFIHTTLERKFLI